MVESFDKKKLGKGGFFVSIEDKEKALPDGTIVHSGLTFRDEFHFNPLASADIFVPCGGRPNAIDITSVEKVFDKTGKCKWRIIVEGANLFITQQARLILEKAGVFLIKDATANKGGVTSSAFEVLSALALTDDEYAKLMICPPGHNGPSEGPAFYQAYTKAIQEKIIENSKLEFHGLWNEKQRTGRPISILSDELSNKIKAVHDSLRESSLWKDISLRKKVIADHAPKPLVDLLGIDKICERVPINYQQAIFAGRLASLFVYGYGLAPKEFDFLDFVEKYRQTH
jgi:glutamate dehydrogenase